MLVFPQKNQTKKFQSFTDNYFNCLRETTKKINIKKIEEIANEIIKTIKKKKIFISLGMEVLHQ